ncbi:MAG: hypothetical protein D6734_03755 [Candidatus Schekmanbacteria bacterium]|nr:MAG: hypothetical protein D6734_03755 [Candidatus Schekmanbacteria bacterium]
MIVESEKEEYVEIFNTTEESEYLVIKSLLESEGIEVKDFSQRVPQLPVNIDGMGLIRIYVNKNEKEKAKDLLKSYYEKEGDNMWKCPNH